MLSNALCAAFHLDDPIMYALYAIVLVFIVALAAFYLVTSLMRAKKLGMDMPKIKKVITSSISFSILPAIGIALGIVTLVGSLGVAFPAIRLSVIGSLQYETQMADGAANAIVGATNGLEVLMQRGMSATDLITIASVMTIAIMSGPILVLVFYRRLQPKVGVLLTKTANGGAKKGGVNIGELIFQVTFIGMTLGYLAMSLTSPSMNGKYVDAYYNFIALVIAMILMYVFDLVITKTKHKWLDSFATPLSMIIAMAVVAVVSYCAQKYGWATIPVEASPAAEALNAIAAFLI
ncbi:MAG: DUF5058 family protein [Bacteroides sp.]|nr:DUF5058 family protein [Bacillota bacterium]MCM1394085.1 DUF5058 family protein [[Eubacterium] siraeum]MCM1455161.1 DUF5058 family protein [Bacteroides sp.]